MMNQINQNILKVKNYFIAYIFFLICFNVVSNVKFFLFSLFIQIIGVFIGAGLLGTIANGIREGVAKKGQIVAFAKKYFGTYLVYAIILGSFMLLIGFVVLAVFVFNGIKLENMNEAVIVSGKLIFISFTLSTVYMPGLIFYQNLHIYDAIEGGLKLLLRAKKWTLFFSVFVAIKILVQLFKPTGIVTDIVFGVVDAFMFVAVCTFFQLNSESAAQS
ncbi:MAG: hypothetical protein HZC17_03060 [Candidatus Omnitrophica bacterium]|nr:hypothetical protein [Candidatus Omnitrophota bacterium]